MAAAGPSEGGGWGVGVQGCGGQGARTRRDCGRSCCSGQGMEAQISSPPLPATSGPGVSRKLRLWGGGGSEPEAAEGALAARCHCTSAIKMLQRKSKAPTGEMKCALSLSLSNAHTTSASKMGQVKAVGVGWGGRAGRRGGPGLGAAWALVPTHPPGIGAGSSCRVGWDVRINIHLPMHMDNAHSCPACFAFIRTNCFRSRAGGREGVMCPFTTGG